MSFEQSFGEDLPQHLQFYVFPNMCHVITILHVSNLTKAKGTCLQAEQTTGMEWSGLMALPSVEASCWVMTK